MKNLKQCFKYLVCCILIISISFSTHAQDLSEGLEISSIDTKRFTPAWHAKTTQTKQEALAYFLQALAHSKSPQEYSLGRNNLARHLMPIINKIAPEEKLRMQNRALEILNSTNERQKLLGNRLSKVNFKNEIYPQIKKDAILRPQKESEKVVPKSGSSHSSGNLNLRLQKVLMKDETNPEGGKDEIFLGAVFMDAKQNVSKKSPFHISDFNEPNDTIKKYNPSKTLKSFTVNPSQNSQTYSVVLMLFEEDGAGMYGAVDGMLNYLATKLDSETYGLASVVKGIIDFIVGSIAGDDAFPTISNEVKVKPNSKDFSKKQWYSVKAHGGVYRVYFKWEYEKSNISQSSFDSHGNELPLTFSQVLKGDDGAIYYVTETKKKVFWFGEHPNGKFSSVFMGTRKGNVIEGEWANTPIGKAKKSGTVKVEVVESIIGNILKLSSQTGGFTNKKWIPINLPNSMPGKTGAGYDGGIGNMDGFWTCDDGGVYYLNQIGSKLYWYGQQDKKSGKPTFANVAIGTINGDKVALDFADVPKGGTNAHGILILQKTGDYRFKKMMGSSGFKGTTWTRKPKVVRPSCKTIDYTNLVLEEKNRGSFINHDGKNLFAFKDFKQAETAYNILSTNKITRICTIGKGKNKTQFLFEEERAPSTEMSSSETFVTFEPREVKVVKNKSAFAVMAGRRNLYLNFDTEAEANTVKQMILKHNFTKYCTIKNNGSVFDYWRR